MTVLMKDVFLAAAATSVAISSLYLWGNARRSFLLAFRDVVSAAMVDSSSPSYFRRDSSAEIAKRTVTLSTTAIVLAWYIGFPRVWGPATAHATTHMGSIIALLWIGPILESPHHFLQQVTFRLQDIVNLPMGAVRELLAAPVAEELIFRHVLLTLLSSRPLYTRIIISSALFSAAHVHLIANNAVEACRDEFACLAVRDGIASRAPCLEQRKEISSRAWAAAKRQTCGQLTVVFLYGLLCGWMFEQCCQRDFTATVVGHSLCNFFGVPSFLFLKREVDSDGIKMSRWRRVFGGAVYALGIIGSITVAQRST